MIININQLIYMLGDLNIPCICIYSYTHKHTNMTPKSGSLALIHVLVHNAGFPPTAKYLHIC